MIALVDERISTRSLSSLESEGFLCVSMPPADHLSKPVASHVDMLVFIGFGRLFCHKRYYESHEELICLICQKSGLTAVISDEPTGDKYPSDVLFNACLVGNNLICNEKTVSRLILDAARDNGCNIVHVPQGYTKCSTCIVSDKAIITADNAIAIACASACIDVLKISEGCVSLPPYEFGFIGGATGTFGNKVYFCGSIDSHKDSLAIRQFCEKHGKLCISLSNDRLQDVGSIYFLGDAMEESKRYWNEKYWVRHMRDDDLDNIEDMWVDKYEEKISACEGNLLDLGCGVGQYSKYFHDNGFDVTSADISELALDYLSKRYPDINTCRIDMTMPLPFEDNSFDIVFANLSIHFFGEKDTQSLIKEVKRILKDGGIFVGSCNSSKAYKYIKDISTVIEDGFYREDGGRTVRLFDKAQFDRFFADWKKISLCEMETVRFNKSKIMWEFIYRK